MVIAFQGYGIDIAWYAYSVPSAWVAYVVHGMQLLRRVIDNK